MSLKDSLFELLQEAKKNIDEALAISEGNITLPDLRHGSLILVELRLCECGPCIVCHDGSETPATAEHLGIDTFISVADEAHAQWVKEISKNHYFIQKDRRISASVDEVCEFIVDKEKWSEAYEENDGDEEDTFSELHSQNLIKRISSDCELVEVNLEHHSSFHLS